MSTPYYMVAKDSKIINENDNIEDRKRESQNKIIAIIFLYLVAILLYFTGRSDEIGAFELLIIVFLFANTVYLALEVIKLLRLRKQS